jgi:1,6-anhydro-N-acetylmuramate kinase
MTDDPLRRLLAARERPRRIIIGLLSGTSADGTDAALCDIGGFGENTGLVARAFVTTPFPRPLRERIYRLAQADASELCDLDVLLGETFADAAFAVCAAAGITIEEVDLIGSHGQTAVHHPRSAGSLGATLQIGEAAVIAERTGRPVISDFRVRDVAAGGEGRTVTGEGRPGGVARRQAGAPRSEGVRPARGLRVHREPAGGAGRVAGFRGNAAPDRSGRLDRRQGRSAYPLSRGRYRRTGGHD